MAGRLGNTLPPKPQRQHDLKGLWTRMVMCHAAHELIDKHDSVLAQRIDDMDNALKVLERGRMCGQWLTFTEYRHTLQLVKRDLRMAEKIIKEA